LCGYLEFCGGKMRFAQRRGVCVCKKQCSIQAISSGLSI